MSLTGLLRNPRTRAEARRILDPVLPRFDARITAKTVVPLTAKPAWLIGTAFDYAARLELAHRAPHARAFRWIASRGLRSLRGHVRERARSIEEDARQAVKAGWPQRRTERYEHIALQATRLAQLDSAYRTGVRPTFGEDDGIPETAIADEIVELLIAAEPLFAVTKCRRLLLNPDFGMMGALVGGADADLIADDTLVEIKTTVHPRIDSEVLRQLMGYVALAASEHMPRIREVAVYFSRQAELVRVRVPEHVSDDDLHECVWNLCEIEARPRERGPWTDASSLPRHSR